MRQILVALATVVTAGCSPEHQQAQPLAPVALESADLAPLPSEAPENKQPLPHQAEKEADRAITQQIRSQVYKEDDISPDAKNLKIVTVDGIVTLRGPVQSDAERAEIGSVAKSVDGVKRVDNQLETATR